MRRALVLERVTFLLVLITLVGGSMILHSEQNHVSNLARNAAQLARDGKDAHDALCAFKSDLKRRADGAQSFLDSHPGGFAGITAPTIQNSINNQEATLRALSTLNCP